MKTTQIIEALLFASDAPLSADDLARGEEEVDADAVRVAIQELRQEYEDQGRAFQIYEIAGGYQLLTRPEYSPHLERFETVPTSTRLSGAALEVLAIIAYRQPLGRSEVEDIRGVGSAHVLRSLQDLDLIEVVGRGEGLGRPLLYGTTERFLDHFGFASLDDLPKPDELPVVLTARDRTSVEGEEGASSVEDRASSIDHRASSEGEAENEAEHEDEDEAEHEGEDEHENEGEDAGEREGGIREHGNR